MSFFSRLSFAQMRVEKAATPGAKKPAAKKPAAGETAAPESGMPDPPDPMATTDNNLARAGHHRNQARVASGWGHKDLAKAHETQAKAYLAAAAKMPTDAASIQKSERLVFKDWSKWNEEHKNTSVGEHAKLAKFHHEQAKAEDNKGNDLLSAAHFMHAEHHMRAAYEKMGAK